MKSLFVFSNLATSLDGKIATHDRSHCYLGTPEDRREMQRLRRKADAILMGASTLRSFRRPLLVRGEKKHPINLILSEKLDGISSEWEFFKSPSIRRVLFVDRLIPIARRKRFERSCEIQLLNARKPIAPQILEALSPLGVKSLLVEGGGSLMWEFVKHDLIDEYHVTLTPKIVGGVDAPTLVEGEGFSPDHILNLKLSRCRRVGSELYLTYQRDGRKG